MPTELTTVRVDDLCLGRTSPKKVMHHRGCSSARADYTWARQAGTVELLAEWLKYGRAWAWHRCCQRCCGDLDDALRKLGVVLDG